MNLMDCGWVEYRFRVDLDGNEGSTIVIQSFFVFVLNELHLWWPEFGPKNNDDLNGYSYR